MIGLVLRPGTVRRHPPASGAHGGQFDHADQHGFASGHADTVCRITSRSQTWAASAWARTCHAMAIEKPGTSSGTGTAASGPPLPDLAVLERILEEVLAGEGTWAAPTARLAAEVVNRYRRAMGGNDAGATSRDV